MAQKKTTEITEIPTTHWADHAAEDLLAKHPGKTSFVCASGISPSGVVHIGNFREAITTEFVVRALRERGKTVRFIYSWDDSDALRKVPANLPNPEMIEKNLRRPLAQIPDPFGTEENYAAHFEKRFEREISQLGIAPEYLYQNQRYRSCLYWKGIQTALKNEKEIAAILNRARTEDLPANWSCASVFCKECQRDTTEITGYDQGTVISYRCKACKKDLTVDFAKEPGVKLLWRVDWPMRWAHEGVDFEPGGKDHSSQGGSFDTGVMIIREIWKKEPPHYVQYDFVLAKGLGSKLSSSSGNLITVGEALEIYEPAIVRYLFASRKPNLDFSIAFDLDVMKAYDDFDRCERFAFGVEEDEVKRVNYEKRIYEFASVMPLAGKAYGKLPAQFPFRHLCNILQIQEGDIEKTKAFYQSQMSGPEDEARFVSRATRAWKWITTFAPEEFRFRVLENPTVKTQYPAVLQGIVGILNGPLDGVSEDDLANRIWEITKANQVEGKAFFQDIYKILVNKPNGPKLASFLMAIGPKRAASILEKAL